jgi:hypothetical protein
MELDIFKISGLAITAVVATLAILKFKLIEELVKKITSDDRKAKGYSILFITLTVLILSVLTINLPNASEDDNQITEEKSITQSDQARQKSDTEVKADAIKEGVELAAQIGKNIVDKKHRKDSVFLATRTERWVFQIGDWTDDDDKILEVHNKISMLGNIKVFKQKRQYLFIKEDYWTRGQPTEASLDSLKNELSGLSINILDLNTFLKNKRNRIIDRAETFGRRKSKIDLECLVID